mgnify:CR=1 FL=1
MKMLKQWIDDGRFLYIAIPILVLIAISCTNYDYEVCSPANENKIGVVDVCQKVQINQIIQPSTETQKICNPNWKESGGRSECEQVPVNMLLLKTGTDKKYCNGNYNSNDFVDNYWNAEGLIDECEMRPNANMQFIFKQHDQSIRSHTGTIQVRIDILNYNLEFKSLQIFISEDNNNDNLPDEWKYCGNVDEIGGTDTKYIRCNGNKMKFVKIVNAEWNRGSLFIDEIEVLKV